VLLLREPGSGTREVVMQALASHGVEPGRILEIGSTEASKQAVVAGVGVSIVSTAAVRDHVKLGQLKSIPLRISRSSGRSGSLNAAVGSRPPRQRRLSGSFVEAKPIVGAS
jgi:DNA-binding transcriptional LysR family regulator